MSTIEVPHLPISEFDASIIEDQLPTEEDPAELVLNDFQDHFDPERANSFKHISFILEGIGMTKYLKTFIKHNVGLETFLHLNEEDLEQLGITDTQDKDHIIKNLKVHRRKTNSYVVRENHLEDLKIAKNVSNQLIVLQSYGAYVEMQMKKHKMIDYKINKDETANTYLKAFIESAITQAELMSNLLYSEDSTDHLIGRALKINNLKLPEHLKKKLHTRKKKKNTFFLKVAVVVGFSSMAVLIVKYLIVKK